jgi:superfamily II DNA/RNA helicase
MRSIVNNVRRDRQTLLFSATMKKKVESFAREILRDPVRIDVGSGTGHANPDVHQTFDVFSDSTMKWPWLTGRLDDLIREGWGDIAV